MLYPRYDCSGVLRVGALGANRIYVLAHCEIQYIKRIDLIEIILLVIRKGAEEWQIFDVIFEN